MKPTLSSAIQNKQPHATIEIPTLFCGEVLVRWILHFGAGLWRWAKREHKLISERVRAGSNAGPVGQGLSAYDYPTLKDILEEWYRGEQPVLKTG